MVFDAVISDMEYNVGKNIESSAYQLRQVFDTCYAPTFTLAIFPEAGSSFISHNQDASTFEFNTNDKSLVASY